MISMKSQRNYYDQWQENYQNWGPVVASETTSLPDTIFDLCERKTKNLTGYISSLQSTFLYLDHFIIVVPLSVFHRVRFAKCAQKVFHHHCSIFGLIKSLITRERNEIHCRTLCLPKATTNACSKLDKHVRLLTTS